jgi:hypothetical protein
MDCYDEELEADEDEEIRDDLWALEETLVKLGIAVANYLVLWLVLEVAHPLVVQTGVREFHIDDLIRAVKVILGEAWFDLPFDMDGELESWPVGMKLAMEKEELVNIVRLD